MAESNQAPDRIWIDPEKLVAGFHGSILKTGIEYVSLSYHEAEIVRFRRRAVEAVRARRQVWDFVVCEKVIALLESIPLGEGASCQRLINKCVER